MNSILPLKEENISGLAYLDFAPVSDVDSIDRPWQEEISQAVVFNPTKSFFRLAFSQETGKFSSPEEKNPSGSLHKAEVVGFTPLMRMATAAIFSEMREDLFVVVVTDNNGNKRLVGTLEEPLRFSFSESTESSYGVRQGYAWAFRRDLKNAPPYYTA